MLSFNSAMRGSELETVWDEVADETSLLSLALIRTVFC
jgi:hypothetical protein